MSDYRLNIKFNEKDLMPIYQANEKLVVVRHTAEAGELQVVWVSFRPFMSNTVDWKNNFTIYSSSTELQEGLMVNKLSEIDAASMTGYGFERGCFRSPVPIREVENNTYAIHNQMAGQDALTFGLAQNVVVNGTVFTNHPINAVSVPFGQTAMMTPLETISIYLCGDIDDSTIVGHIDYRSFPIEYKGKDNEHTVTYDSRIGRFYLIN
ncbi:MAG: hypothetical protein LBV33_06930 [Lachnospiraceae bacterium]|jgi:hypothetical protein|nr:hypothetical protein [Lachnospiraceae bacterium]